VKSRKASQIYSIYLPENVSLTASQTVINVFSLDENVYLWISKCKMYCRSMPKQYLPQLE